MRAAEQGQASTINSNGQHRRKGRLGESMSAFLAGAQEQLPGWGTRDQRLGTGSTAGGGGFGGGGYLECQWREVSGEAHRLRG